MTKDPWSKWTYKKLQDLTHPGLGPSVVAIGMFDGVHIGHQKILRDAVTLASNLDVSPIALTFDRHPLTILAPEKAPQLLTPFTERMERMKQTGINHVVILRFTPELAKLSAQDFLQEILLNALGAKGIVVGYNFRFGKGAEGDTAFLQNQADLRDYILRVLPPVLVGGEHVSSTRIREALGRGRIEEANRLLGYPFSLRGPVEHGDARGRTLGFPTANIFVNQEALWPMDGVYLTEVRFLDFPDQPIVPALTVISDRPSFNSERRTVESFLLHFDQQIYGQTLEISFHRQLRKIIRFSGPDELKEQIMKDVSDAEAFFATRLHSTKTGG